MKIVRVEEQIIRLEHVNSIGVIGDPGCEGLGTYNMKVYAGALEESGKADITLIAGDLVPAGKKRYYQQIQEMTEALAKNPVYCLRGNHDTGEYTEYFGEKNYGLLTDKFAVVVMDNALRTFEEEGLERGVPQGGEKGPACHRVGPFQRRRPMAQQADKFIPWHLLQIPGFQEQVIELALHPVGDIAHMDVQVLLAFQGHKIPILVEKILLHYLINQLGPFLFGAFFLPLHCHSSSCPSFLPYYDRIRT